MSPLDPDQIPIRFPIVQLQQWVDTLKDIYAETKDSSALQLQQEMQALIDQSSDDPSIADIDPILLHKRDEQ